MNNATKIGSKYIINILIGLLISVICSFIFLILIVSGIVEPNFGTTIICATFLVLFVRPLVYNTILGIMPILGNLSPTITATIDIWFYHKNNKGEKTPNILSFILFDIIHWIICIIVVCILFYSPKAQTGCVNLVYNTLQKISIILNVLYNKPELAIIAILMQIVYFLFILYILNRFITQKILQRSILIFIIFSILNTIFQSFIWENKNFFGKLLPLIVYYLLLLFEHALSNNKITFKFACSLFAVDQNGNKHPSLVGIVVIVFLYILQFILKTAINTFPILKYSPYLLYGALIIYVIYRTIRGTFKSNLIRSTIIGFILIQLLNCWIDEFSFLDIIKRYLFIWILEVVILGLPYIKALTNKTQNP